MITITNLSKSLNDFLALKDITLTIPSGTVLGLVGSNGSGKSTFLRLLSGVYQQDSGEIRFCNEQPFENTQIKEKIFFVSDDFYFFPNSTMNSLVQFYQDIFPTFSQEIYQKLCHTLPIDPDKKIHTFSKGMKRQVALIIALSSQTPYLFLDEAFDGIDPMIRQAIRQLIADAVHNRNLTVIITSHNLRELENICDHLTVIHQGKLIFDREIDESQLGFCKVQVAFAQDISQDYFDKFNVIRCEKNGSVYSLILKEDYATIQQQLSTENTLLLESLPLSLEEVFMTEMEEIGYDYTNIIF